MLHHQITLSSFQDSSCISPFSNGPATSTPFGNYLTSALGSGLVEHRFIHLTQYSVFRAYLSNASLLSLAPQLFLDDDALSPYTLFNPFPATTHPSLHTLRPTDLQLSTFHHPYIDLFASPSFRNNVLSAVIDEEQEDMLCMDLHFNGFTVWVSQPWVRLFPALCSFLGLASCNLLSELSTLPTWHDRSMCPRIGNADPRITIRTQWAGK